MSLIGIPRAALILRAMIHIPRVFRISHPAYVRQELRHGEITRKSLLDALASLARAADRSRASIKQMFGQRFTVARNALKAVIHHIRSPVIRCIRGVIFRKLSGLAGGEGDRAEIAATPSWPAAALSEIAEYSITRPRCVHADVRVPYSTIEQGR